MPVIISKELSLSVSHTHTYVKGLPILMTFTVHNHDPEVTYYTLPKIDWFKVPPPLAITLIDTQGKKMPLPYSLGGPREGPPKGFMLEPLEARTELFDLSVLMPDIASGDYQIEVAYLARTEQTEKVSFTLSLRDLSVERSELDYLLRGEDWNEFLLGNPRTIDPGSFRRLADNHSAYLALHLFMHRAVYGPEAVADLNTSDLQTLAFDPLQTEARVLEHEIKVAKDDSAVPRLAQTIVEDNPGLSWRIEENRKGRGRLASLRRLVGAERKGFALPEPAPYVESE